MQNKDDLTAIKLPLMHLRTRSIWSVARWQKCSALMLMLGIGLAGCTRSASPNYYTLTPQMTPLVTSNIKFIEVMPITLPERLNTPLLVLQDANGQSSMQEYQRWTSSFSQELHSALSAGLQQKLGAIDIYSNGLSGGKASYTIATEFSRFDIVESKNKAETNVEVMAAWVIKRNPQMMNTAGQPSYAQVNCRMSFKNKVVDHKASFVDIVSTVQGSLTRVTEAIATSVIAVDAKKAPLIEGAVCS